MNTYLKTSAKMAFAMGIFLPLAETIRRFQQLLIARQFLNWFDDYLLGLLLVVCAYRALQQRKQATSHLLVAWSIATGALLLSFMGQFRYYHTPAGDPGIFSTTFVAIAKGLILVYMGIGLQQSIKANRINRPSKQSSTSRPG